MDQEQLKELLDYCPETGVFTWKVKVSRKIVVGNTAGSRRKDGYIVIRMHGQKYYAHILAHVFMTGRKPVEEIDHENGKTFDNRWVNLKEVSHQSNIKNQAKQVTNLSGVTGVHWCNSRKCWVAQINNGTKNVNLGRFTKFEDAVATRKSAEALYGFHINHGRDAIKEQ